MLNFFYMFDAENDLFRARQLIESGDESATASAASLDFTLVRHQADDVVRTFIDAQLAQTSCLVVLIGQHTASQRWVKYAIGMARTLDKPMIGVTIDKLADADGNPGIAGSNPFASAGMTVRALAALEIYDPPFATSVFARSHIRYNLPDWVGLAVREAGWKRDSRARRQVRRADTERREDAS